METTPEIQALLGEAFERCSVVDELDGPQIEAFVSGLFPLFDGAEMAMAFVDYCGARPGFVSTLVCAALAEVVEGDDGGVAAAAAAVVAGSDEEPPARAQIGKSSLSGAWMVTAPFGRSVMLGYSNPIELLDEVGESRDSRHSILVELDEAGSLVDLQLSGPAELMTDEAASVDGRVAVESIETNVALALITDAWPEAETAIEIAGPGVVANQRFVRRRLHVATGTLLPLILSSELVVDVQRGLDDAEYLEANQAALSTLQAAVGALPALLEADPQSEAWVAVVRGDGGELSRREREALLWLEWADWLGAGIGMVRAGENAAVSGAVLVDYVNRCPEVSSVIDKADREYAEWAFEVALDVLGDAGVLVNGRLTAGGHAALIPALVAAWS